MSDGDRSAEPRYLVAAFLPLVCITLILRLYLRVWVAKAFGWDDGLMVASVAFYIVHSATYIIASSMGSVMSPHQAILAVTYNYVSQWAYSLATVTCKLSASLFLLRIAVKPQHLRLLWGVMVLIILQLTLTSITDLLRCRPLSYVWERLEPGSTAKGTCLTVAEKQAVGYTASANLFIIDILLGIVIPIMTVWNLQMRRASKVAVVSILGLTVFATITICIRLPYMTTYATNDLGIDLIIWVYIELSLGIMAANLATLGPLLRTWLGISSREPTPATVTPLPGPGRDREQDQDRIRGFEVVGAVFSTFVESVQGVFSSRRGTRRASGSGLGLGTHLRSASRHKHGNVNVSGGTSQEQLTFQSSASASSNREFELKPLSGHEKDADDGERGMGRAAGRGILRTTEIVLTEDVEGQDSVRQRI